MSFLRGLTKLFTSNRAKMFMAQLDDVHLKLKMCDDVQVKKVAQELMDGLSGAKNKRAQRAIVAHAEHLLDTVNTAQGKYCNLFTESVPLGPNKLSKKISEYFLKKTNGKYQNPYHSAPRQVKFLSYMDDYEEISNLSSIKRYISMHPEDTKMTSYLYENYYLANLDDVTAKTLRQFDSEFGIKLFMDKSFNGKPVSKHTLQYLYDELANFKQASDGTAKFEPLLDITKYDVMLNRAHAEGISVSHKANALNLAQGGKRVALCSSDSVIKNGRHEHIHWFDQKPQSIKWFTRKSKISPAEIKEMQNAGVTNTWYASTNSNEWKAVWGQGSMKAYSTATKQKMVKMGLPEWITNLDDVYMAKYLKVSNDKTTLKHIQELEQAFNGKIPNELAVQLLDNPNQIAGMNRLLKIKDAQGYKIFESWATSSNIEKSLTSERLDALERIVKININGSNPYIDDLGILLFEENFSAKQVQKICARLEKYANKGEIYDLRKLFDRYLPQKEVAQYQLNYLKEIEKFVTNVTNVK